jgi:hypothetical protein
MPADPEPRWALAAVPPCIDGGHRHLEVRREVFDTKQLVQLLHVGNLESGGLQMDYR